jgi:hypothetical protein
MRPQRQNARGSKNKGLHFWRTQWTQWTYKNIPILVRGIFLMTATALLAALRTKCVHLTIAGEHIAVDAPKGVLTDDVRQTIRQYKQELLALLSQPMPAHDAAATASSPQEVCPQQEHVSPPPYPGHPAGAPFRSGHQVWLYRWDDHTPRFAAPVTIVQMRTLWPGEQDIGWCNAAGALSWHNARLAVAVEVQEAGRRPQDNRAYCAAAGVAERCGA